jgi:anti-sigma factor RsiW
MLSEYLDFELPPEACAEIERHLAGCAPCIDFVESLRRTIALCRQYQPGEMPRPLTESARSGLEQAWRRMLEARGREE